MIPGSRERSKQSRLRHRGGTAARIAGGVLRNPSFLVLCLLPEAASAREIVVGNPGAATGYVRLLEFAGVDQEYIRPSARAWEPGGHGGFDLRVLDIYARFRDFQEWGWHG